MNKFSHFLLLLSVLFTFHSCVDNTEVYTIGKDFVKEDSKITYVDTISVHAYSILRDSFQTSGYNKVFFGYYNDPLLGKTYAESFVQIGYSDNLPDIDDKSSYEKLVLVIRPNGDYLGDTLTEKRFHVFRVSEDIEPFEGTAFYNLDSFARESDTLASFSFVPRPNKDSSYYITLPDELGQLWYDWIVNDSARIETSAKFTDYFKGLVFVPETKDQNWSSSFFGFSDTEQKRLEIRLYYTPQFAEKSKYFSFTAIENYTFTHFITDRSGTISSVLAANETKIPSSQTDNKVFMQAGSGVGIKIEIPQLEWMYQLGSNITLLDARLIIRPTQGSFKNTNDLPSKIDVFIGDRKNQSKGKLTDLSGETYITGSLNKDDQFGENTYYSVPVLNFVLYKMESDEINNDALMFYLPEETMATSLTKLIVDDQSSLNNSFELQIYYYKY